jgi:hypothetical protein
MHGKKGRQFSAVGFETKSGRVWVSLRWKLQKGGEGSRNIGIHARKWSRWKEKDSRKNKGTGGWVTWTAQVAARNITF